ncbi:terpene synthase family protein [Streptomyces thermolineatus]|uniref:terpene synthase family protein n=1 Tax=Streptomyces thermolineatus TaxID=44033 RepID=UPI0031E01B6D
MTLSVTPLRVPEFYCPDPPQVHPAAAELDRLGTRWLERSGICPDPVRRERLARHRMGRFVALTAPRGLDERMQVVTDLNLWYHALDDTYGDAGPAGRHLGDLAAVFAGLLRALGTPESPAGEPFAEALRDIRLRLGRFATPHQLTEWTRGLQNYFLYELWESANRERRSLPDLDAYTVFCADGRAANPSMTMLPIVGGYELPGDEQQSPAVRALTEMSCVIACWDNDVYSYPKERLQGPHHANLLNVLARERGCDPADTVAEAVAMRDRVMCAFLRLRRRTVPHVSAPTARYLADLGSWMRGQVEWGLSSIRFAAPEYAAVMPEHWADCPSDDSPGPLDIPSVAWWWSVDA